MNSEKINDWLGLMANFGVLVGIIFLVLEMQQNQELTQVQIQQSRSDSSVNLALALADSETAVPIMLKTLSGEDLTREEDAILSFYLRATHNLQENVFIQTQNDMLPISNLESIRDHTNFFVIQMPAGRRWWEAWKHSLDPEYVAYVDSAISELEGAE